MGSSNNCIITHIENLIIYHKYCRVITNKHENLAKLRINLRLEGVSDLRARGSLNNPQVRYLDISNI